MSITARLAAAKVRVNKISPYDEAIEEAALLAREFIALSAVALPTTTGDAKYGLVLPDLPAGAVFYIAAVADAQAKLADCGSASTTTLKVRAPGGDVATIDIANSDTNDTLINAASVSATTDIPGGSRVEIDLDAKATGAVGPLTIKVKFSIRYVRNLWS